MSDTPEKFVIVEYDAISAQIDDLADQANFIPDVASEEGYDKSKRISLDVGKVLTNLEKARKAKKAHYLAGGREVDAQAKLIVEKLEQIQLPHKEAYKELDRLKLEREEERKAKLQAQVDHIKNLPTAHADSLSTEVKFIIDNLIDLGDMDYEEFTPQAERALDETLKALNDMFAKKEKAEKDAIELEELRVKQAAQEKKDREEKIAKDAAAAAEKEKEAALEREAQAIKDAEAAETARLEAEKKATADAEQAEKNRIEAEKKATAAAEAAKKKADDEFKAAQKKANDDADKAQKDAAEAVIKAQAQARADEREEAKKIEKHNAEALKKREADQKHIGIIRGEAKDGLMALGLTEKQAKDIVIGIHNGKVKNVSIKY